jgi:hypothetical protein
MARQRREARLCMAYYHGSTLPVIFFENFEADSLVQWEYHIVALPRFEAPTAMPESAAVGALNREGERGWEAVGMTSLADGSVAVLLKRLRQE